MENQIAEQKALNHKDLETQSPSFCEGVSSKKTSIGGQALIEGLMMFGPTKTAMAIRKPDQSIYVEEIKQGRKARFFHRVPVIRGCVRFFRQIVIGTGAMMKSAEMADLDQDYSDSKTSQDDLPDVVSDASLTDADENFDAARNAAKVPESDKQEKKKSRLDEFLDRHTNIMVFFAAIMGIGISVVLFILLPRLVVDIILNFIPGELSDTIGVIVGLNLIEGALRITIFLTYLSLTSRIKEMERVWKYHGAEHKTVACYEAGEPLTVENIKKYSPKHARCGTAFLFIVVIIAILLFSIVGVFVIRLVGANIWWINLLVRLALVPLVGGLSFEVLKLGGRYEKSVLGRLMTKPGMWLQRFTTREPDDGIIEVAIAAMQAVVPERKGEDDW